MVDGQPILSPRKFEFQISHTLRRSPFCLRITLLSSQRARFKAVESLQNPKGRAIVVCTDVASRGLDIPSVATVVHYDVARSVDTFVHRSGRTAVSTIYLSLLFRVGLIVRRG